MHTYDLKSKLLLGGLIACIITMLGIYALDAAHYEQFMKNCNAAPYECKQLWEIVR